ncbi:uncharacterized protein LOC113226621 isoform X2 [Hyposmocoma kahamanoa]|uniref:uncharacterized protein LOC113226621 isoform X2 n=1 Tax=Hyposmocoma kahamanoa TaxID=1477025 RepID=UPI000E6D6774|nr:uncharacterized protein LOC113226621 isoform X2 [Hyposmocoma kahamanoa]
MVSSRCRWPSHFDKRHRSSSSIVGPQIEGSRSERKLDIRASIPEVDDQFTVAEARCNDLQEKIDLVRSLKRKRKLKKRSMTHVNEPEKVPFISVRAQPKKKIQQPESRLRRLVPPPNPMRSYLDSTILEQHSMLGLVRDFNRPHKLHQECSEDKMHTGEKPAIPRSRARRARADGDSAARDQGLIATSLEVACGEDNASVNQSDNDLFNNKRQGNFSISINKKSQPTSLRKAATLEKRRKHVPLEVLTKENRPVVELFSKNNTLHSADIKRNVANSSKTVLEADEEILQTAAAVKKEKEHRYPRRVKYLSRRYEMPTVASQMKQTAMRYYYGNINNSKNNYNIPFIITKSCAPSHNIGVNIQQVLNGLKVQQPLSGIIPLTIAHHMGLGHIPSNETKNVQPKLDNREINAIRLGRRLLRLPSYKYISYNRLLQLYREGEGVVPRFLRSLNRAHCYYTSMYNLATGLDIDGTKSRSSQEAKLSLGEYATLYRVYEQVDKCLKEKYDPELMRRKAELARELTAREEQIRRVVQDYRPGPESETPLRATASTAEGSYRYSSYKLNLADSQH